MRKYKPETKEELKKLVFTDGIKLCYIDTSLITDMSKLFYESKRKDFEGIEDWDVSNVTNMDMMFAYMGYNALVRYSTIDFNPDLSNWNVSKVKSMNNMFAHCSNFNQPLDKWDVSNVEDMSFMFYGANEFNQPLNNWNVSKVKNMKGMFDECENFNQPLNKWDTSNVEDMSNMFNRAKVFNKPLNKWNTSKVKDLSSMFAYCDVFNQNLNDWDVSNVTNMDSLFRQCEKLNQPFDKWDTSNVVNMENTFFSCMKFDQPLNSWNVSNVENMDTMFYMAQSFNQPLDKWDTQKLITAAGLFRFAYKFDHYESLENWNLDNLEEVGTFCDDEDKLHTRLKVYMQAFYPKEDYITITKFNVKEIYNLIAKDKNKRIVRLRKRIESDFSNELSFVTKDYNFKTIEKAEKYAEKKYNAKKEDKKLEFIKDCHVLVKDKSREVDITVIKYIYSEYLSLKRMINRLEKIDNIVNLLDFESFFKFIREIYLENQNTEIAGFIYAMYGGDKALKEISELILLGIDSKVFLIMIKFNIESKYAQSLLYEIYSDTKKTEVRKEAGKMISELLEKMNIGYTEFRLRCTPNYGFDSQGEKILNDNYKLIVNNDYTLSLFDIKDNKELKKIPQNFDEKLKEEIKELRKEVQKFINHTASILSITLIDGDIYSYDLFKEVFIDNYLMNKFASSLIWNLCDKDKKIITTFRYSNDGSYSNCDDEEVKINAGNFISLATPIEMDNNTVDKWRKQLEDYELSQPINQLTLIKLDKKNLKKEIKKIKSIEASYGAFKAFAKRYDMYTNDVFGYNDTITYTFPANDGDIFTMSAKVDADIEYDEPVDITIDFKKAENKKEISMRFVYTFLVFIISDFRLTDSF
ncbi:BspA family leucine-rich repeat surface protein [Brachyspira innocens]|uniref:BspA family leucine-rich repeat surface protein n=1 Tax=Brachyspira innocens TaxID=13264 RepID=A0ABT8YZJ1_9SPIR|nr:BspA family leucine-rich repeat surface protein [Brachyspira innocens]MDO6994144.1 BspA family leucine-rich repeat surface protein [Brachyspira innocens]MDO7020627.1 BspA family leucine-rich repeat surface protein [Brachyspira innocens]